MKIEQKLYTGIDDGFMDKTTLIEIGATLKDARKNAGLSIQSVAKTLRIRRAYITALEKGDTKNLKFDAYTIGYVRHYAELLGLNPDEFLERLRKDSNSLLSIDHDEVIITGKEFLPSKIMLAVCAALLILIYIVVEFRVLLG